MTTKIVVTIGGGCLRSVYCSDANADVSVFDFDNAESDDDAADEMEATIDAAIAGLTEVA